MLRRFLSVGLRQTTTTLFPALTLALGTSFKVAVMAELLANAGGIGGALALARINLDIAEALAWVTIAVMLLIVVEYTLVQPVKAESTAGATRPSHGGLNDERAAHDPDRSRLSWQNDPR